MKRFLSFMLAFAIVLTSFDLTVFAAEENEEVIEAEVEETEADETEELEGIIETEEVNLCALNDDIEVIETEEVELNRAKADGRNMSKDSPHHVFFKPIVNGSSSGDVFSTEDGKLATGHSECPYNYDIERDQPDVSPEIRNIVFPDSTVDPHGIYLTSYEYLLPEPTDFYTSEHVFLGYTFSYTVDGHHNCTYGTMYQPGDWVTITDENQEIYTVYSNDFVAYTATVYGNGGTINLTATTKTINVVREEAEDYVYSKKSFYYYEAPENPFEQDGYEFLYWNTEEDGSGTTYNPGDIIGSKTDETNKDAFNITKLYAIWNDFADVFVTTNNGTVLTKINIPSDGYKKLTVPDTVKTVGDGEHSIFDEGAKVDNFVIPSTVTKIMTKSIVGMSPKTESQEYTNIYVLNPNVSLDFDNDDKNDWDVPIRECRLFGNPNSMIEIYYDNYKYLNGSTNIVDFYEAFYCFYSDYEPGAIASDNYEKSLLGWVCYDGMNEGKLYTPYTVLKDSTVYGGDFNYEGEIVKFQYKENDVITSLDADEYIDIKSRFLFSTYADYDTIAFCPKSKTEVTAMLSLEGYDYVPADAESVFGVNKLINGNTSYNDIVRYAAENKTICGVDLFYTLDGSDPVFFETPDSYEYYDEFNTQHLTVYDYKTVNGHLTYRQRKCNPVMTVEPNGSQYTFNVYVPSKDANTNQPVSTLKIMATPVDIGNTSISVLDPTGDNYNVTSSDILTFSVNTTTYEIEYVANGNGTTCIPEAVSTSSAYNETTQSYSQHLADIAGSKSVWSDLFTWEYGHLTGYNTKADGSGTSYTPGATATFYEEDFTEGKLTLYAQWEEDTYSLKYHPNGATGDIVTEEVHPQTTVTLSDNIFTSDKIFVGWSTAPVDDINDIYNEESEYYGADFYEAGIDFTATDDVMLFAVWQDASMFEISGTTLLKINVPDSENAAYITVPSTITTIGDGTNKVLSGTTNIEKLTFPSSVTTISEYALNATTNSVTRVVIPATTTTITAGSIDSTTVIECERDSKAHKYALANGNPYATTFSVTYLDVNGDVSYTDAISGKTLNTESVTFTSNARIKITPVSGSNADTRYVLKNESVTLKVSDYADENGVITAAVWLANENKLSKPQASVKGLVESGTMVTLSCPDDNSRIYYTDEADSTLEIGNEDTFMYTGYPITIFQSTVIKAMAVSTDGRKNPSDVAVFRYVVDGDDEYDPYEQGQVLDEDLPGDDSMDTEDRIALIPSGVWMSKLEDVTYNGLAQTQNFRVYYGKNLLTNKTNYTIAYKNNVKAGTASVTVTAKGNYSGKTTATFTINPLNISDVTMAYKSVTLKYNKKVQKAANTFYFLRSGKVVTLNNKNDLTYSYLDTTTDAYKAAGTYTVTVTGKGNYTGTRTFVEKISETGTYALSKAAFAKTLTSNKPYTGSVIEPVVANGTIETASVVYKIGKEKVALRGISRAEYEAASDVSAYDYIYEYIGNTTNVGTVYVRFTGINSYSGVVTKSYKITGIAMSSFKISGLEKAGYTFTGSAIDPVVTVSKTVKNKDKTTTTTTLTLGTDYTVSYKNDVKAGTAQVIVTGINAYAGTIKAGYRINKADITKLAAITVASSAKYTKVGAIPQTTVTYNGMTLVNGTDYSLVEFKNNKKLGEATVKIAGKGNYSGKTAAYSYTVTEGSLEDTVITANNIATAYAAPKSNSKATIAAATVTMTNAAKTKLANKTDYTLSYAYVNNSDVVFYDKKTKKMTSTTRLAGDEVLSTDIAAAGTEIKVTATGKNLYSGTISTTYTVYDAANDISKAKVSIKYGKKFYYMTTGVKVKPSDIVVVVNGHSISTSCYEVVSYKNNTRVGTASVTIRGKNGFGGTKTISFDVNAKEF